MTNTPRKLTNGNNTPAYWTILTGVCASFWLVMPAAAQDALGRGNVLDANPSRIDGRINAPSAVPDYRARNLLVTGDVAGGRGFRDTVGYSAAGDFLGELGSDDLFQFRAGAAYSSPRAVASIGDQFRYGQSLGIAEYRRDSFAPRSGYGTQQQPLPYDMTDIGLNDRIRMDQMARSASISESLRFEGRVRPVGSVVDEDGRSYVIDASPLTGLSRTPTAERYYMQELSPLDRLRLREDVMQGRVDSFGMPLAWRFEEFAAADARPRDGERSRRDMDREFADRRDDLLSDESVDNRIAFDQPGMEGDARDQRMQPSRVGSGERDVRHQMILERIARRYADVHDADVRIDPQVLRSLDESFDDLRARLRRTRTDDRTEIDPTMPGWESPDEPEDREGEQVQRPIDTQVFDVDGQEAFQGFRPGEDGEEAEEEAFDPAQLAPALRHGLRIEELTGTQLTRFNELVAMGEQSLRDGEFFVAEQRFIRALRFNPGQPMATAGMAHAQLGAGLHLASALTLKRLFITNPEMIDTRFDDALLPSLARLTQAIENIQERLDEPRDRDLLGFLLAYVGHQLDDQQLVQQGLDVYEQELSDDPLLALLKGIWLEQ
jgi:hypothetical protein